MKPCILESVSQIVPITQNNENAGDDLNPLIKGYPVCPEKQSTSRCKSSQ